ncbi:MAG: Fpg/Nei family DNA glycosylase [Acidimicrobiia bacterium]|nr:Fpg/Nei family DNA glycosylase [Acidimicrobiia bacterium]
MPELPVVQALAERLDALLAGKTLRSADPVGFSGLKTVDPGPDSVVGRSLDDVRNVGKYLVFGFGGARILLHLSQGGRIVLEDPPKTTRPKAAVVRFVFDDAPGVLLREYGTERKAGWWVLAEGDDGPLERLGPDPRSDTFAEFVRSGDDRRRIHTWLRDQRTVAGIGRGLSDDALHRARLSPYATLLKLDDDERQRLLDAIRVVLDDALAAERTRTGGLPPKLSENFAVHGRHGTSCPTCGDGLRRVSYESHEVTYCPRCQTDGKVLADRRMSRLVK